MPRSLKVAIFAGLLAGTIDIAAACLINWVTPAPILRVIASGLIGRHAVHGGPWIVALGLILQWMMSILIAAVFVLAAGKASMLRRRWVLAGIGYGSVVFAVMNFAVVPLSAAVIKVHFSPLSFAENLLAMWIFGLIIAHCVRHADDRH